MHVSNHSTSTPGDSSSHVGSKIGLSDIVVIASSALAFLTANQIERRDPLFADFIRLVAGVTVFLWLFKRLFPHIGNKGNASQIVEARTLGSDPQPSFLNRTWVRVYQSPRNMWNYLKKINPSKPSQANLPPQQPIVIPTAANASPPKPNLQPFADDSTISTTSYPNLSPTPYSNQPLTSPTSFTPKSMNNLPPAYKLPFVVPAPASAPPPSNTGNSSSIVIPASASAPPPFNSFPPLSTGNAPIVIPTPAYVPPPTYAQDNINNSNDLSSKPINPSPGNTNKRLPAYSIFPPTPSASPANVQQHAKYSATSDAQFFWNSDDPQVSVLSLAPPPPLPPRDSPIVVSTSASAPPPVLAVPPQVVKASAYVAPPTTVVPHNQPTSSPVVVKASASSAPTLVSPSSANYKSSGAITPAPASHSVINPAPASHSVGINPSKKSHN